MRKMTFLILLIFFQTLLHAEDQLCGTVVFENLKDIKFTDTEKDLLCGTSDQKAYQLIPPYQAQFFLRGFLQSRSYLDPKFEIKNNVLYADVGKKFHVSKIKVKPETYEDADQLGKNIYRVYRRRDLDPKLLNTLEADAVAILKRNGRACAEVKSEVQVEDGTTTLNLENTKSFLFGEIPREDIPGLHRNALDRFYPFKARDRYNELLLELTEKRLLRAEVVQGTYFLENCSDDGEEYSASQEFILGPPRTLRFGVGASTEVGPMTRVSWSNNRYGPMASLLAARAQASFRSQSLLLTADNFFWKDAPRRSLLSQVLLRRDSQLEYEELLFEMKPQMKWTRDFDNRHWLYMIGPTFQTGTFHTSGGSNTRTFTTGTLEGRLQWMTHIYEFYDLHPEEGSLLEFNFDFRHPSIGFAEPLLKLDSTFVKLSKLYPLGRGNIIGGMRVHASTTWVPEDVSLNSLPPSVKLYGGGSDDIRGFQLRTLPKNDGQGSLTKLVMKLEFRKTYIYREDVEVFGFFDYGHFSEKSWNINNRIWHSPGVGARWKSPIGIVQGFVSRGLVTNPREDFGNLYFLGLGGTF